MAFRSHDPHRRPPDPTAPPTRESVEAENRRLALVLAFALVPLLVFAIELPAWRIPMLSAAALWAILATFAYRHLRRKAISRLAATERR